MTGKETNGALDTLEKRLAEAGDFLPTCMDYGVLLNRAAREENIPVEEARRRYGLFTYRQWKDKGNGESAECGRA